jgi:GrpB-like predicted nucleotidyltransferase (UPF0157 family)
MSSSAEISKAVRALYSTITMLLLNQAAIGSTAVAGIWSKNIVDVMIELPESSTIKEAARIWICRQGVPYPSAICRRQR